ncbi:STAS domain-containing protein [Kibdelosporangium phytohabitans]|uniref:STAS domain-containing protein n=1 Tax=Kibdelosporangium phytohabitans TaxID=860235 RepID=UPI0014704546|nr:STAS domain-containing protein [Kibdelosporangium phytohabitans]MBE1470797.1 ABC-type transporter Mla MlaB component [Kibdelosporangium phytohabitans]
MTELTGSADDSGLGVLVVQREGNAVVVNLSGDLDHETAPDVRDQLLPLLADRSGLVVLDLGGLEFLGSAGLAVLVEVAQERGPDSTVRMSRRLGPGRRACLNLRVWARTSACVPRCSRH